MKRSPDALSYIKNEAGPKAPQTVELGFSEKQVTDVLGQPEKILKLGPKTIYVYKDLKVTFTDGLVADLQ